MYNGSVSGFTHGTAKNAHVIPVKVLNQFKAGTTAWLIEGLEWVSNQTKLSYERNITSVINLSLGMLDPGGTEDWLDDVLQEIPAVAVAAAGNEDDDACRYVPARFSSVITVAATNDYDRLPSYTNYGSCVDLLAPGHRILSASHRDTTSEVQDSGTSMSAGFVSGVVAQYLQNYEYQPTTSEIRTLLQDTASVNKTNAGNFGTLDYLVYAACPENTSRTEFPDIGCPPDVETSSQNVVLIVVLSVCVAIVGVGTLVGVTVIILNKKKYKVHSEKEGIKQNKNHSGGMEEEGND